MKCPNCISAMKLVRDTRDLPYTYKGDGMWQFHTPEGNDQLSEEDARIVSLYLMWKTDPSIAEVADLAPGWVAWRESVEGPWRRTVRDSG